MAPRKQTQKKIDQAKLQTVRTVKVSLTLEASEHTLQCLAALMMLSDPTKPALEIDPVLLPYETPEPLPLDLDYNMIRNHIMSAMETFVMQHGRDDLVSLLKAYTMGGKLSEVGDIDLMDLLADLEAANG